MTVEQQALCVDGFVAEAYALDDPGILPAVLDDTPIFDAALAEYARKGWHRVPYLLTEAITRIARDQRLVDSIERALDTDCWVMWGANIRRSVPNQAQRWHVDLESVLWPMVTVGIGLHNCSAPGATWFIPGSHRLRKGPSRWVKDCTSTNAVLARARALNPGCGTPQQVAGFQTGYFYLFDGCSWHKADETGSAGKIVLYLHYQRGDRKRVPHMLDYVRHTWSLRACPYIASCRGEGVKRSVYLPPLRHLISGGLRRGRCQRT